VSWLGSPATSISLHRESCGIACGADVAATPKPSSVLDTSRASAGSASDRVSSPAPPHPSVADPAAPPDESRAEPSPRCHVRQGSNNAGQTGLHASAGRAGGDRGSPNYPIAACRSRGSHRSHHVGETRRTRTPIAGAKTRSSAADTALVASSTPAPISRVGARGAQARRAAHNRRHPRSCPSSARIRVEAPHPAATGSEIGAVTHGDQHRTA